MKKVLKLSGICIVLLILATSTSFAQDGDIKIGGGLIYGSEIEQLGLRADGYYSISEDWRAGVALGYFFPKNDINWFEIDLNANYVFHSDEDLSVYAIGGLNFMIVSFDIPGAGSNSNSEFGINLGGGLEYGIDFGSLFGELKYAGIGGDADQLVIGAGLRFNVN